MPEDMRKTIEKDKQTEEEKFYELLEKNNILIDRALEYASSMSVQKENGVMVDSGTLPAGEQTEKECKSKKIEGILEKKEINNDIAIEKLVQEDGKFENVGSNNNSLIEKAVQEEVTISKNNLIPEKEIIESVGTNTSCFTTVDKIGSTIESFHGKESAASSFTTVKPNECLLESSSKSTPADKSDSYEEENQLKVQDEEKIEIAAEEIKDEKTLYCCEKDRDFFEKEPDNKENVVDNKQDSKNVCTSEGDNSDSEVFEAKDDRTFFRKFVDLITFKDCCGG